MPKLELSDLLTDDACCFLCGSSDGTVTLEHVFPKWLQKRFNLWDQSVGLLNGTEIPYRQLTVPCCSRCNSEDLSRLEGVVSSAVKSGYKACSSLNERLLYLWAGKLYFGILRKEVTLAADRSSEHSGSILPEESLKSFSELHLFLQGIRGKHEFQGRHPYSVFVFNLHDVGDPSNFGFRDSLFHMTLGLRMGDVGIIVALGDAGLTNASFSPIAKDLAGRKIHPIQFDEIYAKVLYQASLLKGGVIYVTEQAVGAQPAKTLILDGGYKAEWSLEEYSKVLRPILSDWFPDEAAQDRWFKPPGFVPTWLTDDSGSLLLQPLSVWEGTNHDA